jgi:uncharacterized RDD family membrane protein YckC
MSDPNQDPTRPFGAPATPPPPPGQPPSPPYPASPPLPPQQPTPQPGYPAPAQPPYPPPAQPGYAPPTQPGYPPAGPPGFAPGAGAPPPGYGPPTGFQPAAQPYQYGSGLPGGVNLATPGTRILGYIIDVIILMVVYVPLYVLMFASLGSTSTTTDQFGNTTSVNGSFGLGAIFLLGILVFGIQAVYHIAFVALKGQTPGAMVVKVKVVRLADGQVPGWGPAFMRWVPNLVGLVPCVGSFLSLGLWIWALVNLFNNSMRQTPFDLAAKTVVIDVA